MSAGAQTAITTLDAATHLVASNSKTTKLASKSFNLAVSPWCRKRRGATSASLAVSHLSAVTHHVCHFIIPRGKLQESRGSIPGATKKHVSWCHVSTSRDSPFPMPRHIMVPRQQPSQQAPRISRFLHWLLQHIRQISRFYPSVPYNLA